MQYEKIQNGKYFETYTLYKIISKTKNNTAFGSKVVDQNAIITSSQQK